MMTAKPQCCPQCSGVEYYTTLFFHTQYKVCQSQTLFQWQKFVVAQTWQGASTTEAVLFKIELMHCLSTTLIN